MADYRYQLFFLSCLSGSEPVEFSDLGFERQEVIPVLAEIPSFLLACAQ